MENKVEVVGPTHYRLESRLYSTGANVIVREFFPVKKTACGYWVAEKYYPVWMTFDQLKKTKHLKWVSTSSYKRYCYPTLEEALTSFKRRKEVYLNRLKHDLDMCETVLKGIDILQGKSVSELTAGVCVGKPDCFDDFYFE